MMKRLMIGVAALGLAVVGAGGVAAAASSNDGGAKTIVLAAHQTDFAMGVHSDGPPAPGDTFVLGNQLRNTKGNVVGSSTIACTVAFHGEYLCQADIDLTGRGHIEVQGALPRGTADLAVIGGTGEFRFAAGQATVVGSGNVDQQTTIHLR